MSDVRIRRSDGIARVRCDAPLSGEVAGCPAAAFATNCYVIAPGPGEECIVVDPGIGVEETLREIGRASCRERV